MRKKLIYLSAILSSAMFATSAHAAVTIVTSGSSGTFADDAVDCATGAVLPCSFTRSFDIVAPVGFNLANITIGSTAINAATNIDFSSVTFNGKEFDIFRTGTQETRDLLNQSIIGGAPNRVEIRGTTGGAGAFSGSFVFAQMAAVPEPATWMMMLLGMAGIGFTMRRKEKQTLRVRYT